MGWIAACTERGARPTNEDACCALCAQTAAGEVAMGVVCDGLGGLEWGEVASSTVVARFVRWFEDELPGIATAAARGRLLADAVRASWEREAEGANECLWSLGRQAGSPLATTLTAVLSCGGSALVAHVGDCRALLLGQRPPVQLTRDQTPPGTRGALLQAVGAQPRLAPAFATCELGPGEAIAIVSDGVWGTVGNGGVAAALGGAARAGEPELEGACERLVAQALAQGSPDNATVVCLVPCACERDALPTMAWGAGCAEAPTVLAGAL